MAYAVVGIAGDEFSARWLAGVKNTKNTAVVGSLRRCSGDYSGGFRHGGGRAHGRRSAER
jgi:hypothetical protein